MREISFDTETTGFAHDKDDRIVELGCVELVNHIETGEEFQCYINPERPMGEGATRVTGITDDMLVDKPVFADPSVVEAFLDFVGDAIIVAHNAEFDRNFVNAELARLGKPPFPKERFIDTLVLAKEHRPGSPASLDAVCKRFNISIEDRELHGALKDARLLAKAYLELRGGRERKFDFSTEEAKAQSGTLRPKERPQRPTPLIRPTHQNEQDAHKAFVESLGENAIWLRDKT